MLWFYCLAFFLFRSGFRALLSFSDISKLSPLGRPFSPPYEIVSIPTMIVNACPRDLVPQREYFLQGCFKLGWTRRGWRVVRLFDGKGRSVGGAGGEVRVEVGLGG